jgi:rod shape determining protein RodA
VTDNPNKKSLWDKIHIDPAMLLILLALLFYSALVIWSASGQVRPLFYPKFRAVMF